MTEDKSVFIVLHSLYTYTYDANKGVNAPSAGTKEWSVDYTMPTSTPTRDGYRFLGWSEDKNATTPTYKPGYVFKDSNDTNRNRTFYAVWELLKAPVTLTKTSSNTSITNSNASYSYAGAEYQVYRSDGTTKATDVYGNEAKFTINANGTTNTIYLRSDWDFVVKEIPASGTTNKSKASGYDIDTVTYHFLHDGATKPADTATDVYIVMNEKATRSFVSTEPAEFLSGTISIDKMQNVLDSLIAQKHTDMNGTEVTLAKAQFTVKYYDTSNNLKQTWVIKTIYDSARNRYTAALDEAHKVSGNYYYDNGKIVFPIGTYTIEETAEPDHFTSSGDYVANGKTYSDVICTFKIGKIGDTLIMGDGSGNTIQNLSNDNSIEFTKDDSTITSDNRLKIHKQDVDGNNLSNVQYTLYYDEDCTIPVQATESGLTDASQVLINYVKNGASFKQTSTSVDGTTLNLANTRKIQGVTGSNGYLTFYNIPDGDYYLKEDDTNRNDTQLLAKPIHIGIDNGAIYIDNAGWQETSEILIQNDKTIPVINTGGLGWNASLFYGGALTALISAIIVRRKQHAS